MTTPETAKPTADASTTNPNILPVKDASAKSAAEAKNSPETSPKADGAQKFDGAQKSDGSQKSDGAKKFDDAQKSDGSQKFDGAQKADAKSEGSDASKTNRSAIKPDMSVVCSNNGEFGIVDHMQGKDTIKLKRDTKGQHHFIPMSWVTSVDGKVHVDRPGEQAMREWKTTNP